MTFKHKLSSRLALMRDLLPVLAAGAGILSCEVPAGTVTDPAQQVVQLRVVPESLSLDPTQQMKFAAYGRTVSGDSAPVTVTWSATGGGITSAGMFTADTAAGDFAVTGNSATLKLTASSKVHVRPRSVNSVGVSPASVSLTIGQTVQLTATPRDAGGNALAGRVVTWGTSNTGLATVSASGLVTGVGAGAATITATSEGKNGTAAITVTGTPAPVASVSVSPATTNVTAGQTVQLTATPRDASGNTLTGRVVTWGSSNTAVATVNGNGLVTGVAAGVATITATSEGKSGTAAISVTLVPVASVSVSPASTSVTVGQTVQVTAMPRDASGNALAGRVVTWGSSNTAAATVNGSGLVTGVAAGSATITATSEGKSGTAAMTVTATSGGGTVLFQETFEDNAFAARSWYDNTSIVTTTAEHVPGSTRALEIHFAPGSMYPTSGGATRHLFSGTESVYLSYWVKYSANWVGSGKSYHPHEFMFMTNEEDQWAGPSVTHLTTYVEDNYQSGGVPVLALQDGVNIDQSRIGVDLTSVTENRAAAGCNGNTDGLPTGCYILGSAYDNEKKFTAARAYFLATPGPGYKGDWHLVEAYFKLNSIVNGKGMPDGIARYWFDGQLVLDNSNVLLRTGAHPNMQFNQFLIGPYIGDGSPVDQTMWVDNLTVATAKP